MKNSFLLFGLGLFAWAQSIEGEGKSLLYYDPTLQALIVMSDSPQSGDRIEVLNLIGQRVKVVALPSLSNRETFLISVGDLPEALYYARWVNESGRTRAIRRFALTR